MGTHPIFESDFDCLTDFFLNFLDFFRKYLKMATSSLARDFRKINIEQYDEDFYVEDDLSAGASEPDHNQIQMAISGGKPLDALKSALSRNPAGSSDIQLKLNCTESALRAMGAHKSNQIESSIKSLSIGEQ